MKVIFLDFDGVLNSTKYMLACGKSGLVFDPTKMLLLQQIQRATDAKIVLSTSWREYWSAESEKCTPTGHTINAVFREYGLRIFDKTPELNTAREREIEAWLGHHKVKNFVVLDDRLMHADFLDGHYIKTSDYFGGLDETDAARVIEILNG